MAMEPASQPAQGGVDHQKGFWPSIHSSRACYIKLYVLLYVEIAIWDQDSIMAVAPRWQWITLSEYRDVALTFTDEHDVIATWNRMASVHPERFCRICGVWYQCHPGMPERGVRAYYWRLRTMFINVIVFFM